MALGFDRPVYFLPFDHRASMQTKMFGWPGVLDAGQTAEIAAAKRVIYEGFQAAVAGGVPKDRAAVLVDEQFGAAVLRDAARDGFMTACPVEKSGQKELAFEYGDAFAAHVEAMNPTFCKVLVRYNPEGDRGLNERQAALLKKLCDYLRQGTRRFLIELHVDAEAGQLASVQGDKNAYNRDVRPGLIARTLRALQDAGVEPDIWKVEGVDRREEAEAIVAAARREGREKVGCIILGGGAGEEKVREWLTTAAAVPGFIGFAVGRSTFREPIMDWRAKRCTRDAAVAEIARRYREWVDVFEDAQKAAH